MSEDSSTSEFEGITWPDYLVIVAYFLFVLAVGLYVRSTEMSQKAVARLREISAWSCLAVA